MNSQSNWDKSLQSNLNQTQLLDILGNLFFDEHAIKLISSDFSSINKQMGASGIEKFIFKALKLGSTKIKMSYKRSWEKGSRNEKEFYINIT